MHLKEFEGLSDQEKFDSMENAELMAWNLISTDKILHIYRYKNYWVEVLFKFNDDFTKSVISFNYSENLDID